MSAFYLIDGLGQLYRAFHAVAVPLSTATGLPTQAVLVLSTILWKLRREQAPGWLAIAWDAPGPTFRDRRFADYKATRAAMPGDLARQLPYARRLFDALGAPVLEAPGWEADDVIATVVERVRAAREAAELTAEIEIVVVSGDKDLLQLVGPGVRVMSFAPRGAEPIVWDEAAVRARWGVAPAQIPDVLALMGDAVDNVPGVKGVGEKTAARLVAEFGSVGGLYANLPLVAGKLRETLAAGREAAQLSRELVELDRVVPVEFALERCRAEEPDWEALRALWTELEFTRLLRELPAPPPVAAREVAELAARTSVPRFEERPALDAWLRRLPAGAPLAVDWAGVRTPSRPSVAALVLFHPEGGAVSVPPEGLGWLEGRELVAHDGKRLIAAALGAGAAAPAIWDTAVAGYLLAPGRAAAADGAGSSAASRAAGLPGAPAEPGPGDDERCAARARAVWELRERLEPELAAAGLGPLWKDVERPLIPVLARMELDGIGVDPGRLEEFAKELDGHLERLTAAIHTEAGEPFAVGSPRQLARILFEKLALPVIRRTKTGPSTDADVLAALAPRHALPALVLEHRTLAKLKGTYADTLPGLVDPVTGRLHTTWNQMVAATGRLSSQDPNLMNIPVRTELGRRIRAAFVPVPGWRFVAADYSQIELRILAHLSREPALVDAFARGEDIHRRTAAEVFGLAPDQVGERERTIAKSANYGILYGVSAWGLSQATGIDAKAAQRYIADYFARHPAIRAYIDRTLTEGRERGWVATLLGRRRYLPDLVSRNPVARAAAERMAINAPVQGTASDMIKLAMIEAARGLRARGFAARLLLQVHDELVFEAPPEEVEAVAVLARAVMGAALPLAVPVVVDVSVGSDWADT